VHYVPVQNDYSDVLDALIFFRGDPAGARAHDAMAQRIAEAGRAWSLSYWRKEDLTAYMFRWVAFRPNIHPPTILHHDADVD
jgi:hypothetical protein